METKIGFLIFALIACEFTVATIVDNVNECDSGKCNSRPSGLHINLFARKADPAKQESCIVCDSLDDPSCATEPLENDVAECFPPHKCFHYINATSGRTVRGCTEDIPDRNMQTNCLDNVDECKTCTGTDCNSRLSFTKCLDCRYAIECVTDITVATSKTCPKYNDRCYTSIGRSGIERGCLSDKPKQFLKYCRGKPDKCEICKTQSGEAGCNTKILEELEYCVDCDSNLDKNCANKSFLFRDKICNGFNSNEKEGCFLRLEGDHFQRGCWREITPEQKSTCEPTSDTCKPCVGTNCNAKNFQSCAVCDSRVDIGCSGNTTVKGSVCEDYAAERCFLGIDAEGYTQRFCGLGLDFKYNRYPANQLLMCEDNNCNEDEIFPENRLQCYQCSGGKECDYIHQAQRKTTLEPAPCGKFEFGDRCYTHVGKDKKVTRGCLADNVEIKKQCEDGKANCLACDGDGCNDAPKATPPKLACLQCDKSAECATGKNLGRPVKCKNNVPLGSVESCYIRYNTLEGWAERGCTVDAEDRAVIENTKSTDSLITCSDFNGCNSANVLNSYCYSCDSKDDPSCKTNPDPSKVQECISPNKCYHFIHPVTGRTMRGCTDSIKDDLLNMCMNEMSVKCKTCTGSKCNSEAQFSSCLTCKNSYDCAVSTKLGKALKSTMCKAYGDPCFTFIGKSGVERGCLAAKPRDFIKECRANPDKCNLCQTSGAGATKDCNTITFDVEYCTECDSLKDMCAKQPNIFRDKMCNGFTSNEKEGCYLRVEGGRYQRGCVRDLSSTEKPTCEAQTDTCKTCSTNNCNVKKDFMQCIQCNSKDDASCARSTNLSGSICRDYLSELCMSGLDTSGYTQRFCTTAKESKQHPFRRDQYETCSANNCNTNIWV